MTDQLAPGAVGVLRRVVAVEHCTRRGDYDIFSTPNLVLFCEEAAIEALAPYLRANQGSVGSQVQIAHVAPTLKGQRVTVTAAVTEVDRRRVVFSVIAEDGVETVAHGTHERFVIDLDKFGRRLAEKATAGVIA
jgi:predicted thioesterase